MAAPTTSLLIASSTPAARSGLRSPSSLHAMEQGTAPEMVAGMESTLLDSTGDALVCPKDRGLQKHKAMLLAGIPTQHQPVPQHQPEPAETEELTDSHEVNADRILRYLEANQPPIPDQEGQRRPAENQE
ncbi:hypothetical protein HPB47_006592 [Ixodes persulcatus]|uniref:Uncharacterized protein n=1 Tax=Ixodes persulcatus TaxID=34615 RepID=A0AC60P9X8_IXOPE|nr:hypothetical protein HPB47_006592 [Ixodes persulcatus]